MLIYQSPVPVSLERHAAVCVEALSTYAFTEGINAVPLTSFEFARAAPEYAIVFAADEGGNVMPVIVLGLRDGENRYLDSDAGWKADYVPAFVRRYPFVLANRQDSSSLSLCIDEAYPGLNRSGRGKALFGRDAKPTPYVETVLTFLQEYQVRFERTRAFCGRLAAYGLLKSVELNVVAPQGGKVTLGGLMVIDRDRLRSLDGAALSILLAHDELELIYLHLASLRNLGEFYDGKFSPPKSPGSASPDPA